MIKKESFRDDIEGGFEEKYINKYYVYGINGLGLS
jgi:hypothetical protein